MGIQARAGSNVHVCILRMINFNSLIAVIKRNVSRRVSLTHGIIFQGLFQQQVAKYFVAVFRQFILLFHAAVILETQNYGILGSNKRSVSYSVDHILEKDIGAHSFAMCYNRLLILAFPIPTVQFDAPTVIIIFSHFPFGITSKYFQFIYFILYTVLYCCKD